MPPLEKGGKPTAFPLNQLATANVSGKMIFYHFPAGKAFGDIDIVNSLNSPSLTSFVRSDLPLTIIINVGQQLINDLVF